jgi:hypothetical protein
MPDLSTELCEVIVAYKTYLESGERRQQMAYQPYTDWQFGECYSPTGKIDCIVFRGPDAVARLRPLRERLRDTTEAAFADESLAGAADALATGIPFMTSGPDASVNQTNMLNSVDPVTGETRPFCEYIRADVLAVLDRALKRMPGGIKGDGGFEERSGRSLADPISVVSIVKVIGRKAGRSDKLAERMKRRNYPVEKLAGKHHCQRADAIVMFPHHRQRIEEI